MNIAEFIALKLGGAAQSWTPKQTQIENVRNDVARLETKLDELKTLVVQKEKTPLEKAFEARGK